MYSLTIFRMSWQTFSFHSEVVKSLGHLFFSLNQLHSAYFHLSVSLLLGRKSKIIIIQFKFWKDSSFIFFIILYLALQRVCKSKEKEKSFFVINLSNILYIFSFDAMTLPHHFFSHQTLITSLSFSTLSFHCH